MRHLLAVLLLAHGLHAGAQFDRFSFRHNYAFIEDGPTLTPLKGTYHVEYIGRGQHWTVTDPRWTVHHPGQQRSLTPCIKLNGAPLMVVEMGGIFGYPDNKLIVIRGSDTMIVDLNLDGRMETRMLERTAKLGVPARPPVLLPFRNGWFTNIDLVLEPNVIALTEPLGRTAHRSARALQHGPPFVHARDGRVAYRSIDHRHRSRPQLRSPPAGVPSQRTRHTVRAVPAGQHRCAQH
jgi:hypothetical protein